MSTRFQAALDIVNPGACNPSGIALALHEACKECIAEGANQRADPAVRLIAYQLAHLLRLREIDDDVTLYAKLVEECKSGFWTKPSPSS